MDNRRRTSEEGLPEGVDWDTYMENLVHETVDNDNRIYGRNQGANEVATANTATNNDTTNNNNGTSTPQDVLQQNDGTNPNVKEQGKEKDKTGAYVAAAETDSATMYTTVNSNNAAPQDNELNNDDEVSNKEVGDKGNGDNRAVKETTGTGAAAASRIGTISTANSNAPQDSGANASTSKSAILSGNLKTTGEEGAKSKTETVSESAGQQQETSLSKSSKPSKEDTGDKEDRRKSTDTNSTKEQGGDSTPSIIDSSSGRSVLNTGRNTLAKTVASSTVTNKKRVKFSSNKEEEDDDDSATRPKKRLAVPTNLSSDIGEAGTPVLRTNVTPRATKESTTMTPRSSTGLSEEQRKIGGDVRILSQPTETPALAPAVTIASAATTRTTGKGNSKKKTADLSSRGGRPSPKLTPRKMRAQSLSLRTGSKLAPPKPKGLLPTSSKRKGSNPAPTEPIGSNPAPTERTGSNSAPPKQKGSIPTSSKNNKKESGSSSALPDSRKKNDGGGNKKKTNEESVNPPNRSNIVNDKQGARGFTTEGASDALVSNELDEGTDKTPAAEEHANATPRATNVSTGTKKTTSTTTSAKVSSGEESKAEADNNSDGLPVQSLFTHPKPSASVRDATSNPHGDTRKHPAAQDPADGEDDDEGFFDGANDNDDEDEEEEGDLPLQPTIEQYEKLNQKNYDLNQQVQRLQDQLQNRDEQLRDRDAQIRDRDEQIRERDDKIRDLTTAKAATATASVPTCTLLEEGVESIVDNDASITSSSHTGDNTTESAPPPSTSTAVASTGPPRGNRKRIRHPRKAKGDYTKKSGNDEEENEGLIQSNDNAAAASDSPSGNRKRIRLPRKAKGDNSKKSDDDDDKNSAKEEEEKEENENDQENESQVISFEEYQKVVEERDTVLERNEALKAQVRSLGGNTDHCSQEIVLRNVKDIINALNNKKSTQEIVDSCNLKVLKIEQHDGTDKVPLAGTEIKCLQGMATTQGDDKLMELVQRLFDVHEHKDMTACRIHEHLVEHVRTDMKRLFVKWNGKKSFWIEAGDDSSRKKVKHMFSKVRAERAKNQN